MPHPSYQSTLPCQHSQLSPPTRNNDQPSDSPVINSYRSHWLEMARQSSRIFLFLTKNRPAPPPLPFNTKLEMISSIVTISHYLTGTYEPPSQPTPNPSSMSDNSPTDAFSPADVWLTTDFSKESSPKTTVLLQ